MFIAIHKQVLAFILVVTSLITGTSIYALQAPPRSMISTSKLASISGSIRFAVIGDFGDGSQAEADVATRVKSWNPDFIITTGDNNYAEGEATTIDPHIGQFYHDYIYPYKGTYGSGATTNRFFPTLGNHDWTTASAQAYLDYFTLPSNERYYDYTRGAVHFFAIDSDDREPDGNTSTSTQATWLKNKLSASTLTWNVVYFHHSPYSSGSVHPSTVDLQWPFASWGADAVLTAHSHDYERIFQNGIVYFVDGLGGSSIHTFGTPVAGSQVRYNGDYGAMLVDADSSQITYKFINRTGVLIDSYTVQHSSTTGHIPSAFSKANPSNGAAGQGLNPTISWNISTYASYYEYCIDTINDNVCNSTWVNNGAATGKSLTNLNPDTTYYWQVRAVNSTGTTVANSGTWWSFTTVPCYSLTQSVSPSGSGAINADPAPNCNSAAEYAAGTVVQLTASSSAHYGFDSWSGDATGSSNPISVNVNANKSVIANFIVTNMDVYIRATKQGSYLIPAHTSLRKSFLNINDGPAKVNNTDNITSLSSLRVIFNNKSYSEMMGLPVEQVSQEYWFPTYNNATLNSQLRVGNLGNTSTIIKVYLGTQQIDSYTLAAGAATRKNYTDVNKVGLNGGPLRVTSSATKILSTIRLLYNNQSFSELMGLPKEQLTNSYLFPYYNNVAMTSNLQVSNVGTTSTTIKVYLGTTQIDSFSLAAKSTTSKIYSGQNSGPLKVTSSAANIVPSIRVLYAGQSYSEMIGYPANKLRTEYWYPVYDNATLNSQLRVSNVGTTSTTIKVYLGTTQIDSYTLAAGAATRKNYSDVNKVPLNGGPLHVVSSSQPILSTMRELYQTSTFQSFYEMMGMPATQLSTQYYFPWYNNVAMNSELRLATP